jgi:FMN phosphatase YigB (HAD superfamily)
MGVDFKRFLYEDVESFMCNAKNAGYICHLVTFGRRSVQECKVKLSGIEPYFTELFYVEQGSKAAVIKKYLDSGVSCEKAVFIDDTIEHLEQVKLLLPQVMPIRIARLGAKGSEIYCIFFQSIASLEEIIFK